MESKESEALSFTRFDQTKRKIANDCESSLKDFRKDLAKVVHKSNKSALRAGLKSKKKTSPKPRTVKSLKALFANNVQSGGKPGIMEIIDRITDFTAQTYGAEGEEIFKCIIDFRTSKSPIEKGVPAKAHSQAYGIMSLLRTFMQEALKEDMLCRLFEKSASSTDDGNLPSTSTQNATDDCEPNDHLKPGSALKFKYVAYRKALVQFVDFNAAVFSNEILIVLQEELIRKSSETQPKGFWQALILGIKIICHKIRFLGKNKTEHSVLGLEKRFAKQVADPYLAFICELMAQDESSSHHISYEDFKKVCESAKWLQQFSEGTYIRHILGRSIEKLVCETELALKNSRKKQRTFPKLPKQLSRQISASHESHFDTSNRLNRSVKDLHSLQSEVDKQANELQRLGKITTDAPIVRDEISYNEYLRRLQGVNSSLSDLQKGADNNLKIATEIEMTKKEIESLRDELYQSLNQMSIAQSKRAINDTMQVPHMMEVDSIFDVSILSGEELMENFDDHHQQHTLPSSLPVDVLQDCDEPCLYEDADENIYKMLCDMQQKHQKTFERLQQDIKLCFIELSDFARFVTSPGNVKNTPEIKANHIRKYRELFLGIQSKLTDALENFTSFHSEHESSFLRLRSCVTEKACDSHDKVQLEHELEQKNATIKKLEKRIQSSEESEHRIVRFVSELKAMGNTLAQSLDTIGIITKLVPLMKSKLEDGCKYLETPVSMLIEIENILGKNPDEGTSLMSEMHESDSITSFTSSSIMLEDSRQILAKMTSSMLVLFKICTTLQSAATSSMNLSIEPKLEEAVVAIDTADTSELEVQMHALQMQVKSKSHNQEFLLQASKFQETISEMARDNQNLRIALKSKSENHMKDIKTFQETLSQQDADHEKMTTEMDDHLMETEKKADQYKKKIDKMTEELKQLSSDEETAISLLSDATELRTQVKDLRQKNDKLNATLLQVRLELDAHSRTQEHEFTSSGGPSLTITRSMVDGAERQPTEEDYDTGIGASNTL